MTEQDENIRRFLADKEKVWQLYEHLERVETRLASQMGQLRIMASTWLLATLGAVGLVLINGSDIDLFPSDRFNGLFDNYLVAALATLSGAIGVCLLWFLDSRVFRKLMATTYAEAINLEKTSSFLYPVRIRQSNTVRAKGKHVPHYISMYFACIVFFLMFLFSLFVGLCCLVYSQNKWLSFIISLLLIILTSYCLCKYVEIAGEINWLKFLNGDKKE